ncbi:hypothetical protein WMY93_026872 [Mugilogobius chulae]|uniref:Uncharacterized protein n=1 Tax=Mugilogobius chulae TaxID=88201 RepID=A0AAW0MYQ1_9GOBI
MSRRWSGGVCRGLALLTMLVAWREKACEASGPSSGEAERSQRSAERASWDVLHRNRRSWVWNQFFVLEEYTGNEPLYVGKPEGCWEELSINVGRILVKVVEFSDRVACAWSLSQ